MTAEEKLARQPLSLIELAGVLRNASEACRRRGVSRNQFYGYQRRFQTYGLEGLKDLPPIPKSHPMTIPPEVVQTLLEFSSWTLHGRSFRLGLRRHGEYRVWGHPLLRSRSAWEIGLGGAVAVLSRPMWGQDVRGPGSGTADRELIRCLLLRVRDGNGSRAAEGPDVT